MSGATSVKGVRGGKQSEDRESKRGATPQAELMLVSLRV